MLDEKLIFILIIIGFVGFVMTMIAKFAIHLDSKTENNKPKKTSLNENKKPKKTLHNSIDEILGDCNINPKHETLITIIANGKNARSNELNEYYSYSVALEIYCRNCTEKVILAGNKLIPQHLIHDLENDTDKILSIQNEYNLRKIDISELAKINNTRIERRSDTVGTYQEFQNLEKIKHHFNTNLTYPVKS